MQQFAVVSVYPRNIAWLIRLNEWDRFEKIIKYNCAMIGGYFNVFIPLVEHDAISDEYQKFLADYDPDLIVLAPGMTSDQLGPYLNRIQPFGIIPWGLVPTIATLDPLSRRNGMNAVVEEGIRMFEKQNQFGEAFVAVADVAFPDTSRLALVACGDVHPRKPMFDVMDGDISFDTTGYRELFLQRLLANGYDQRYVGAYLKDEQVISAPDRYQLSNIISEKYKFPLSGAVKILNACCRLQHSSTFDIRQSFTNLTVTYNKTGRVLRRNSQTFEDRPPAIVILVSDNFSFEEALLFWNLRANNLYVVWLSFTEFERDQEAVAKWLDSDVGGTFYWMFSNGSKIAFSSADKENSRLQTIVNHIQTKRTRHPVNWDVIKHQNLVFYDNIHLPVLQERVTVMKNESKYTFIPKLPPRNFLGVLTTTLEWNGCMLPRHNQIIQKGVSLEAVKGFSRRGETDQLLLPRFRITNEHYLKAQIENEHPLEFNRPSPEQIIHVLFETANFTHIEHSSAARYHTIFINRAGGLDEAAHYLATSPYRELLEILSDNNPKNKVGWLLTNPSKRRALHHLFLRDVLGKLTTDKTREYFNTVSDELPIEAFHLLEKGLLERGFLLKCRACSFHSWYPAEHIGQTFECARCFQTQVYASNPLWLYKLPEVIFQGFEDNMQVPILTLNYFKRISRHYFEWVPDSNVYQRVNGNDVSRNLDLLIICDGKFYIGEAKSNNEIDAEQFSFYEEICRRVAVDGVVFATSQSGWSRATQQRIDRLKTWFIGEVLILTGKDLYVSIGV